MTYTFSVLPSTFIYTNPSTVLDELPAVAPNFGLEDGITWKGLMEKVQLLNKESKDGSLYKLTFVGRHGQGFHSGFFQVHERTIGRRQRMAHRFKSI